MICLGPRGAGAIVGPRPLSGVVVRPLNFTVRFRMRRAFALLSALFGTLRRKAVAAQPEQDCVVTVHADGTCEAAGLRVPCREIGPKLHEAGIPAAARIRFSFDRSANYDVVSAAFESVQRAGLKMKKLGYINFRDS